MSDQPQFGTPEWARNLHKAANELGKGLEQTGNILAAQGAMGWAYRGDLPATRAALAVMTPDQLVEVSAAATLLAALCDEEMSSR